MAKSIAACLIVLMVLASTLPRASAAMVIVIPPPAPATSMTLAAGGGLAVGIIATAGLLCIYDVWLKITGVKNWDGSAKVVQVSHHHRAH